MSTNVRNRIMPLCALLFVTVSGAGQAPSSPARVRTKQPPPQPQAQPQGTMATWDASTESLMGISKTDFEAMGLGKLTVAEYSAFGSWFFTKEAATAKEALANQLTHSCGRSIKEPRDLDKVNIYLKINDPTPDELASRIRQNLRAINDVQIVFSEEDADLTVGILGFPIESTSGQRTGNVVSIVTSEPCISKIGTQQFSFGQFQNQYLQTGGKDATRLAETVATSLDASDIESERKSNSVRKQFFQINKK
jgi:hypothetical protein